MIGFAQLYRQVHVIDAMKKIIRLALLLVSLLSAALFVGVSPVLAQQQQPVSNASSQELAQEDVVRITTNLVTVPVSVMDRHGRFIPDLNQGQFHLYENGIEQEIAYFDSAEAPFTVALLLDTSDSTRFKFSDIQEAAIAFVDQLRPVDRVIVIAFDKRVKVLAEATSDRGVLENAIRRTQTGGGTSLYNAFDVVVNQRLNRIRGRKAIVVFTDGVDTSSLGADYQGTLRAAEELDALVYAIQYNTYDEAVKDVKSRAFTQDQTPSEIVTARGERLDTAYDRANRYLRLMTDKSGGRFFYADTVKHLAEVFAGIAKELREQYSIGYYPKNEGQNIEQRNIKVKVGIPAVVVRARKSYSYNPSATTSPK